MTFKHRALNSPARIVFMDTAKRSWSYSNHHDNKNQFAPVALRVMPLPYRPL
jgi:hypothetical protein